jgi:hypothetical protein
MILTDRFVERTLAPSDTLRYLVEAGLVVAVIGAGWLLCRKKCAAPKP